ncbi:uncharacterized protein IWZ02DRAFT_15234 [Phyllosticta citriasiana]|uniref:uncharacterized protein n=1 Tax=Phyllosticta citriasiana TaxID=595635 RepID=UPI0030FD2589
MGKCSRACENIGTLLACLRLVHVLGALGGRGVFETLQIVDGLKLAPTLRLRSKVSHVQVEVQRLPVVIAVSLRYTVMSEGSMWCSPESTTTRSHSRLSVHPLRPQTLPSSRYDLHRSCSTSKGPRVPPSLFLVSPQPASQPASQPINQPFQKIPQARVHPIPIRT